MAAWRPTVRYHLGRLFDHVHLRVADLEASRSFYRAALGALGTELAGESADHFWVDELYVSADGPATTGLHLAFQAGDRAAVERFHRAAIEAGGRDNGAPGERSYGPGYYAAYALDPDGNNVEAVIHEHAHRSATAGALTIAAGVYEFTPLKRDCRWRCRTSVRSGFQFGLYCVGCSYMADHVDGAVVHLNHRDVTFVAVSRAPLERLNAYKDRIGWSFPWVSFGEGDLNLDFSAFTEEQRRTGSGYNFGTARRADLNLLHEELHGLSAFALSDGVVYHTYSCYDRGTDVLSATWQLLDRTPKGRGDDPEGWPRRHDEYK